MVRMSLTVSSKGRIELRDTIVIRDLDTTRAEGFNARVSRHILSSTKKAKDRLGCLGCYLQCGVEATLSAGGDTRVDTRGVAVPDIRDQFGDRLARVDVDELQVEVQRDTSLALGDVLADKLPGHVVGTNGRLRHEGTGVVGREDGLLGRGQVVATPLGPVVAVGSPLLQASQVLLLVLEGLCILIPRQRPCFS